MSSFSGWAVVDLTAGRDLDGFVAALCASHDGALRVLAEGHRIFVYADFGPQLAATIKTLLPRWGTRAIAAADYDEYGVTTMVLGPDGTAVHVASISEQDEAPLPDDDTPRSRGAAAELFDRPRSVLDELSSTWALDGAMPWVLGEPYLRWWDALGVPWPTDFGDRAIDPRAAGVPGRPGGAEG